MATASGAIVVGVDGSEESARAVRWAAAEARLRREPLHVVHGFEPLVGVYAEGPPFLQEAYDEQRKASERFVAEAVRSAEQAGGGELTVSSEMADESPETRLIELSRTARAIVLGSSGISAFTGMLVGSTTVAVAAHGQCPVVVVRGPVDVPVDGPVVVGVDGSPISRQALPTAFEEASLRDAPLVAVHAWVDTNFSAYGTVSLGIYWSEVQGDEQRVLAEQISGWQKKYPDVRVERVVVMDRPRHQLLSWSERAQLVVVGSRGRGGFAGLLLGSTSQALIHHAGCPVMIVRPEPVP